MKFSFFSKSSSSNDSSPANLGEVWVAYNKHTMGDSNNGRAIAEALKPTRLRHVDYKAYMMHADLPHHVSLTIGDTRDSLDMEKINTQTQAPEIIIDSVSAYNNFHKRLKGSLAQKIADSSFDKSFTVRMAAPDIALCGTTGRLQDDPVFQQNFGADLNIVYSHQIQHADDLPPHTVVIDTVPTRVNAQTLAQAGERFRHDARFAHMPSPDYMVIVGERIGAEQQQDICGRDYDRLARTIADAAAATGGSVAITTSPRTTAKSVQQLREALEKYMPDGNVAFYDFNANRNVDNPYLGMLANCKRVLATDDSLSMLSDVVAAGKPLYIFDREKTINSSNTEWETKTRSHLKYIDMLKHKGFVQPIEQLASEELPTAVAYNSAEAVAQAIRSQIAERRSGVHIDTKPLHIKAPDMLEDEPMASEKRMEQHHAAYRRGDELPSPQSEDRWRNQVIRRAARGSTQSGALPIKH